MSKSFGANIVCSVCSAQPFPDPGSGFRETFDLVRIGYAWFCELHRPPKEKLAARSVGSSPFEAITELERLVSGEIACLETEIRAGDRDDAVSALTAFQQEVERGFGDLKKAISPREPPPPGDTPKPRSKRLKPIKPVERLDERQISLIEEEPK